MRRRQIYALQTEAAAAPNPAASVIEDAPVVVAPPVAKKRGRPAGSKNNKKRTGAK